MIVRVLEQGAVESGLDLPKIAIPSLVLFATELKAWNRKINLTAITRDDEIAVKHLLDTIFLSRLIGTSERVLDIGSGAGVPSIPLKIVRPDITVVSVDAVAKKIHFQRHVARLLKLQGFEAVHSRVEALHATRSASFDVVVSRAFSDLGKFIFLAGPLLCSGGRAIAMKGAAAADELVSEKSRLERLGYQVTAEHYYDLPFDSGKRCLIEIKACKGPSIGALSPVGP